MTEEKSEKPITDENEEMKEIVITKEELNKLKEEASEFKHKYLQLLADSENARKRLTKERQDIIQYAIQNVLLDFLNPIDHMENALGFTEQANDEIKHWATGFGMIMTQFKDVLSNNGVKPMDAIGKEFDPHLHEAVEMIVTEEHPPGTVVEESSRGYVIGEKTLRPARVKVAKAPEAEVAEEELENKE